MQVHHLTPYEKITVIKNSLSGIPLHGIVLIILKIRFKYIENFFNIQNII